MEFEEISKEGRRESSAQIRERVTAARQRQKARFAGRKIRFNGDMQASDVERYCRLGDREKRFMEQVYDAMQLSARGYHRILRVARTIADLDDSDRIQEMHLAEAVCYRRTDQKYWQA